jgi:hypothetical protein
MDAGGKGLFLKILQKDFVFLHKNTRSAPVRGIFLYNYHQFPEIFMVFRESSQAGTHRPSPGRWNLPVVASLM